MRTRLSALAGLVLVVLHFGVPSSAATSQSCQQLLSPTPSYVALYEQKQKDAQAYPQILANQADYNDLIREGGGGACAPSAAFNLLVGLRQMIGLTEPLDANQTLRRAYAQMPDLRDGRVSNDQLKKLLRSFKKFVGGRNLRLQIDRSLKHREDWQESKRDGALTWTKFDDRLLNTQANELKLLTYRVLTPEGKLLGRHFVVLLEFDSKLRVVSVLDSNRPDRIFKYDLKTVQEAPGQETVELHRSPGGDRGYNSRLDSVITVKY